MKWLRFGHLRSTRSAKALVTGALLTFTCCAAGWADELSPTVTESSSRSVPGDFDLYWRSFRHAALNNPAQLARLALDPVEVRGELDGETPKHCDTGGLIRSWPSVLARKVQILDGDRLVESTLRDYLQKHSRLAPGMVNDVGDHLLRVQDFVFEQSSEQWHLKAVYADLAHIDCASRPTNALSSGVGCADAVTQADINECMRQRTSGSELESFIRDYKSRLSERQAQLLDQAQARWEEFRQAHCQFETSGSEGGSAHSLAFTTCLKSEADSRLAELRNLAQCAEGDLNCPAF